MMVKLLLMLLLLSNVCWADSDDDLIHYSQRQEEDLVVKVIASDLVVLEDGRRVKLIGIESLGPPPVVPVKHDAKGRVIEEPQPPTIPIEEQAIAFAQDLLENKKVKLEFDVDPGDTRGYTYAYVFLPDGRMANAELLRFGFVKLRIIPPNVKYEARLQQAYQEAKREKRGILDD